METKELLKKVRKIEIKSRGKSTQVFSGGYNSAFKGRGMSFSEVREYQYGDDVRNIDWNVTARYNTPFIKVFEEERELNVMFLIDVSKSAFFGSDGQFKNEIITEICAVIAFSAINNNDKVGVVFFSDIIEKFIPPKKGKSHILRIIRELIEIEPKHVKTDISVAMQYMTNVMKKRSIMFVLSDFMDTGFKDPLSILNRKHDVVGVRVFDKFEQHLPPGLLLKMEDAETNETFWLDTSSKNMQKQLHDLRLKQRAETKQLFAKSGADLVEISTDESYLNALMTLFAKRGQRR